MYQPKYDYREVLKEHGIDIQMFKERLEKLSGGSHNQAMFEFLYETAVINNYTLH